LIARPESLGKLFKKKKEKLIFSNETSDMSKHSDDSMLFPQKLMDILEDPQNQDIISWLPHGKSFVIRDRTLFADMIMPRYFPRKAKYSSFTRKLNRWYVYTILVRRLVFEEKTANCENLILRNLCCRNFMRVANGPEPGAYFHKFFLRDQPQLAAQMFCKNARTMLAMNSNISVATSDIGMAKEFAPIVPILQQTSSLVSTKESPTQLPLTTSSMWSMKMNPVSTLEQYRFAAPRPLYLNSKCASLDHQVALMQQEKELLNRMMIERVLRFQQHSNVVVQQGGLLQMRRMIEMDMNQHRLQQQQTLVRQPQDGSDGTARLVMNNRASAA
jgi:hypothetical protein